MSRRTRMRLAWVLLAAITITAADLLTSSQVHEEQAEDSKGEG